MIEDKDYFEGIIIGQEKARRTLSTLVSNYYTTGYFPPTTLVSSRGHGKTSTMKNIASFLYLPGTKKIKPFIPFNAKSYKTVDDFFDKVVDPHLTGDKYATVAIDEISGMSEELYLMFLSILNITDSNTTDFIHNGTEYHFDNNKITWLFSTTNLEALTEAFLDRVKMIQLVAYTNEELAQILKMKLNDIEVTNDLALDIVSYTRSTPRCIQKISKDLSGYIQRKRKNSISESDWVDCIFNLSLLKEGLEPIEVDILKTLKKQPCSLTKLSSILTLDRSSLQSAHEKYLLKKQMMVIELGKRTITNVGRKYLEDLEKV